MLNLIYMTTRTRSLTVIIMITKTATQTITTGLKTQPLKTTAKEEKVFATKTALKMNEHYVTTLQEDGVCQLSVTHRRRKRSCVILHISTVKLGENNSANNTQVSALSNT